MRHAQWAMIPLYHKHAAYLCTFTYLTTMVTQGHHVRTTQAGTANYLKKSVMFSQETQRFYFLGIAHVAATREWRYLKTHRCRTRV